MAESDEGAERSHEPTQKRKDDAREEGQILTSKELLTFGGFVVASGLVAMAPSVVPQALPVWESYLRFDRADALGDLTNAHIEMAFWHILGIGVAVATPLALLIIGLQIAVGGIQFNPKSFSFKPDRINPATGLKRMASVAALVELVKALGKVAILGAIAWAVVEGRLPQIDRLWSNTPVTTAVTVGEALTSLMWSMTLGLGLIGAADLGYQIYTMRKQLMMTLQEVKQESKEQNGSPEVKGRLRQLQMEASRRAARRRQALDDVPNATTVITNPTHFAVALRYVPGETRAPVVVAMGKGPMAFEIMSRARKSNVSIQQIPILARALYFTGDIGIEINEHLFTAVAAVLAHVYRLDRGEKSAEPHIDLPPELRFSEFGQPERRN